MSLTLTSLAALLVNWYVTKEGIALGSEDIQSWIQSTVLILAPVGVWYGRYRHGDITWYGATLTK